MAHIDRWHAYAASKDPKMLWQMLDEDVTFHSPVVHTPQQGRDITALYLRAAIEVLFSLDFEYVRTVDAGSDSILEFRCTLDGIVINGVDMIHWNEEGKITDFKVMVRPLKAMQMLHQKMGEMLARMQQNGT